MELVTRKSQCKSHSDIGFLIKSPKEIAKNKKKESAQKYCIIVKPFHASFLPYRQIVFRGVTFSDDFSIELIRNNEAVLIADETQQEQLSNIFHANGNASFRIMS